MGISPFFRNFSDQPTLEERLADNEEALLGSRALQRAERARAFALSFAAHRADPMPPSSPARRRLHDFAEMLLWCTPLTWRWKSRGARRPIPRLQRGGPARGAGHELYELEQPPMRRWHLLALLMRASPTTSTPATTRSAGSLWYAPGAAPGPWLDNAALPDDLQ